VINTNLPHILHCFGDIVFDTSQIAIFQLYFASPLAFKPTDEGFPPVDPRNNFPWMSVDIHGTKWRRNIVENCNRLSRTHERYRRQTETNTDGRAIALGSCMCTHCSVRRRICYYTIIWVESTTAGTVYENAYNRRTTAFHKD